MAALYNKDILRLASSLVPDDRLSQPDGSAQVHSKLCGSKITADIAVDETGIISAIALRANACAIGQASAAIVRMHAIGETASSLSQIRQQMADFLQGEAPMPNGWPELSLLKVARDFPARHAALLLPYDAVLAACKELN
jgi:NifU-like protein involved in Fe-S cluster formation